MSGRKRHIVVDTTGLLLAVVVHAASIQDRDGAKLVLGRLLGRFPRLQIIWADAAYAGKLIAWTWATGGWLLQVVRRSPDSHHFEVLPRRWVVERTLAWLSRCRRLSKRLRGTARNRRNLGSYSDGPPDAQKTETNLIPALSHTL